MQSERLCACWASCPWRRVGGNARMGWLHLISLKACCALHADGHLVKSELGAECSRARKALRGCDFFSCTRQMRESAATGVAGRETRRADVTLCPQLCRNRNEGFVTVWCQLCVQLAYSFW